MFFLLYSAIQNSPALGALLKVVDHQDHVKDLKDYTQKHWIRKANQEREDLDENQKYKEKRAFIYYCFQKLGMMNAVMPQKTHYDYVVIHGAMTKTMQARIDFFKRIRPHVRYKQIVFLSGKRMLDPVKEKNHLGLITEAEMAAYLMKKNGFKNVEVVNAVEFKGVRPNTQDTIVTWLRSNPRPGTVLAISNNPYIPRQDLTLKQLVKSKDFDIETVGPQTAFDIKGSVLFDELARLIYTEMQ